ncbi:MAG: pilus assembly PilX N-terminal domain-containing protein [Oceanisphaera sp.]|uniref:pilus assembly PilX N-terminal domain-containing protein n=1 Tax=Oceanisphaera sp. TaxID=1929979 RepID=UPI003C772AFA
MKAVQGFTTLTVTLILISILISVSVFIGKVLVAERRITLNEIEYRVAQAAAEQGIAEARALLNVAPTNSVWAGTVSSNVAEVSYQVTMVPDANLAGLIHLESVATLPGGGESRVKVTLARRSVLNPHNSGPAAPLMLAAANNDIDGNITVVAHPNGGGAGVPISVWSKGTIATSGQLQSCYLADFNAIANHCVLELSHKNSTSQNINSDMVIDDGGFPADLLSYLFGYGQDQWSSISAMAVQAVSRCDEINRAGFFIITDGGVCALEQVTSSALAPVILLAKDISVTGSIGTQFYGLLVLYDSDPSDSNVMSVQLNQGSQLFGSLLSNLSDDSLKDDFAIIYHQGVLCLISNCNQDPQSPFVSLNTIPGSWTDD